MEVGVVVTVISKRLNYLSFQYYILQNLATFMIKEQVE